MKTIAIPLILAGVLACGAAQAQPAKAQAPKGFDQLGWIAGTRYIERDGARSYETWTAPAAGLISGAVASVTGGGLQEFFAFGPNAQGVYGLATARTTTGLQTWTFRPMKSLEANKVVFADGAGSFSIERMADGGIHNIAARIENGKESQSGEWFWKPLK
jgi:hypothetical protein